MKHKLVLGWLTAALVLTPLPTDAADPPQIIISEVNWAGSELSAADEWLELYNLKEEAIDLSLWSIEGAAQSGGTLTMPEGTIIEANSTYLIANYGQEDSTLAVDPDLVTTSLSLSNSGLRLVLYDGSGAQIDDLGDGGSPAAGFSGSGGMGFASMIRSSEAWISGEQSLNFDQGLIQYGTPGHYQLQETAEAVTEEIAVEEEADETMETIEPEEMPTEAIVEEAVELEETPLAEPEESEQAEEVTQMIVSYPQGTLIINEIMSDPGDGVEWVEIYNPYNNVIPLDGWTVVEGSGKAVALSGLIGYQQFVVAEFFQKLNNDGDSIALIAPDGSVSDAVTYSKEEAANDGSSLALNADGQWEMTLTPTKNSANQITVEEEIEEEEEEEEESEENVGEVKEMLVDRVKTLRLASIIPDPLGDEMSGEQVVIENYGDEAVTLDGWMVADASKTYELKGVLAPGLSLILPRSVSRLALNNTSKETVTLVSFEGEIIDNVSYDQTIEGAVYARTDAGWEWTGIPAELEPQDIPEDVAEDECRTPDEDDGDDQSDGVNAAKTSRSSRSASWETVEGVVIAPPGAFGSQIIYIDGLQIFQYQGDFPALTVGEVIRAAGTRSTAHGEPRLKIASASAITVIGSAEALATEASLNALASLIGHLVKVEGTVISRSSDRLTIAEDGDELNVIIKQGTGISLSSIALGDELEVTGVLSSYDDSLRLLPRETDDVVKLMEEVVWAETTSEAKPGHPHRLAGIMLTGATVAAVGGRAYWWQRRRKNHS